jgi:hypothetical protein
MASRYFGLNLGDQGYVTIGSVSSGKDVEIKILETTKGQDVINNAVQRVIEAFLNDSHTNS